MERFIAGDIVVVPFPFSDLSSSKRRPALVLASLEGNDIIVCQITSQARFDKYAIILNLNDFEQNILTKVSLIRPNRIFTANESIIIYKAARIKKSKLEEVYQTISELFTI